MHDVIVVGGGFAGVTAAREAALGGRSVLLLEARDRLGGRTWTAPWDGTKIEYGGAWVHWHQPHTFSEITRAGLAVRLGEPGPLAGRTHPNVARVLRAVDGVRVGHGAPSGQGAVAGRLPINGLVQSQRIFDADWCRPCEGRAGQ